MSNMNKVLGFERINERHQRPNKLINFIKPREGPDKALAQDFLERVAAICYPIMRANHIVVMSLEEYPANKEFLGRNFNAGEIIQLVLKSPSGQWYPFKHVQMVMMHELAHCKHMNHSKDFWKVNNANRDELKALWARNYFGDGLWGRGQTLLSGKYSNDHMPEVSDGPTSLCGGTYRSRGRKRKRNDAEKPKVSYAERKQRRIAKKFGVNGQALGADEYARFGLDQGRHRPSKPRVAGSKRGRELRAAAALARFDNPGQKAIKQEPGNDSNDDDYETDSEDEEQLGPTGNWDENDNVIKICAEEDTEDGNAQRELDDLKRIDHPELCGSSNSSSSSKTEPPLNTSTSRKGKESSPVVYSLNDNKAGGVDSQASTVSGNDDYNDTKGQCTSNIMTESVPRRTDSRIKLEYTQGRTEVVQPELTLGKDGTPLAATEAAAGAAVKNEPASSPATVGVPRPKRFKTRDGQYITELPISIPPPSNQQAASAAPVASAASTSTASTTTTRPIALMRPPTTARGITCQVCSFKNQSGAATCAICAHVIDAAKIKDSWQCEANESCKGSAYRNMADYGRCFVCGTKRPPPPPYSRF